jgi:hypothetical protein
MISVLGTLEKRRKPFAMANFPGEIHFFLRVCILRDAWKGTDAIFDRCLDGPEIRVDLTEHTHDSYVEANMPTLDR